MFSVSSNLKNDILCNQCKGLLNLPLGVKNPALPLRWGAEWCERKSPIPRKPSSLLCQNFRPLGSRNVDFGGVRNFEHDFELNLTLIYVD